MPRRPSGSDPRTPLWQATQKGWTARVLALLQDGVDPDNKPTYGYAPLHAAIQGNHVRIVQALLEAGGKPGILFRPQRQYHPDAPYRASDLYPLHMAILERTDSRITQLLLEAGADPQKKWHGASATEGGPGALALHTAAAHGAVDHVRVLVTHPSTPLNGLNSADETPLQVAAHSGQRPRMQEIVTLLLDAQADIEGRPSCQESPLWRSLAGGHLDLARLLLAHGADLQAAREAHVLHAVVRRHRVDCLRFLLSQDLSVHDRNADQRTPLHEAVQAQSSTTGHLANSTLWARTVCTLLEAGADVHAADRDGNTPLHFAAEHGHRQIWTLLLRAGADPERPNAAGCRPQQRASEGRLTTFHAPHRLSAYRALAEREGVPLSDLVAAALDRLEADRRVPPADGDVEAVVPPPRLEPARAALVSKPGGTDTWEDDRMLQHLDPWQPAPLLAVLQEALATGRTSAVDEYFLTECLLIEMAGPERGDLATGHAPYTRSVLAGAILWLQVGAATSPTDDVDLTARVQGVRQMVTENLIDRIQAYVAVTLLLQPNTPAPAADEAAAILDDIWQRARTPDQAQADTLHPITAFGYAA